MVKLAWRLQILHLRCMNRIHLMVKALQTVKMKVDPHSCKIQGKNFVINADRKPLDTARTAANVAWSKTSIISYITLPMYALVAQMGSHMNWHNAVKKRHGKGGSVPKPRRRKHDSFGDLLE
ncbi:hypothetical protein Vadar_027360 [Vaccinium darrowii]|uniref:Uncharacterized protein n=1 Tax=Vaccinium darrowii TaxID=229202 RepID=A0ACB7YYY9_9ERIC|nr:hypothetical protein Vadar_027360 [Vaccinium darrowii]